MRSSCLRSEDKFRFSQFCWASLRDKGGISSETDRQWHYQQRAWYCYQIESQDINLSICCLSRHRKLFSDVNMWNLDVLVKGIFYLFFIIDLRAKVSSMWHDKYTVGCAFWPFSGLNGISQRVSLKNFCFYILTKAVASWFLDWLCPWNHV